MKLAALMCSRCRAGVDTDDPLWFVLKDTYYHRCIPDTVAAAVLRRTVARQEAIDDELQAIEEQAERVHGQARRAIRAKELGLP